MSQAEQNLRIDYIEFAAVDLPLLKQFYEQVFGWRFTDYGPHYSSFTDGRMTGGFTTDSAAGSGPLVVIYAADLEAVCDQVAAAGGHQALPPLQAPATSEAILRAIGAVQAG